MCVRGRGEVSQCSHASVSRCVKLLQTRRHHADLTYPAAAASAPVSRLSCLAGVASRSRRWFVWTPSPLHSGNKPSWSLKSSPHELKKPVWQGGGGVGGAGLHLTQSTGETKKRKTPLWATVSFQILLKTLKTGARETRCRIWPFLVEGKTAVKCQIFDSLVKVLCKSSGYGDWQPITDSVQCSMSANVSGNRCKYPYYSTHFPQKLLLVSTLNAAHVTTKLACQVDWVFSVTTLLKYIYMYISFLRKKITGF